jgi:sugar phosphate isomerase/epimerase
MQSAFYTAAEIRERLSISTLVLLRYKPLSEKSLAEVAEHGIRQIELIESLEQYDFGDRASMRFVGEICGAAGVRVAAYHAHKTNFNDVDTEQRRRERVEHCKRQIDTLTELGGTVWGCHAADTQDGVVKKSYQELARHCEGTNVVVTVENFSRDGVSVEDRVRFLDDLDHPQVGMILDIGHVRDASDQNPMTRPGGPTNVVGICGHRLRHIHLHGFVDTDHYPPFHAGDRIQWVELFGMLKSVDYPGLINFEPSTSRARDGGIEAAGTFPDRIIEMAHTSDAQTSGGSRHSDWGSVERGSG